MTRTPASAVALTIAASVVLQVVSNSRSAIAADAPSYQSVPSNYFSLATMPNGDVYLLGRAAGQVRYRVSTNDGLTFNPVDTKLFDSVSTSSPIPVIIQSTDPTLDGDFH